LPIVVAAILMLVVLLAGPGAPAQAQGQNCTMYKGRSYCDDLPGVGSSTSSSSSSSASSSTLSPIGLGTESWFGQNPPATFGAITFNGSGTRCMGLLRQGNC
jgi:hypothetical protein